jgi:glyceraldehyde-3-phosphate dehydrogenase/erythrose-4-phosphate dehydrogenase
LNHPEVGAPGEEWLAKVRVAINGFRTIGERVADAVAKHPDLERVGVAKTRPGSEARRAMEKDYSLYITGASTLEELI